jgi:hypothetical protein
LSKFFTTVDHVNLPFTAFTAVSTEYTNLFYSMRMERTLVKTLGAERCAAFCKALPKVRVGSAPLNMSVEVDLTLQKLSAVH